MKSNLFVYPPIEEMDEAKARSILGDFIQLDGSLKAGKDIHFVWSYKDTNTVLIVGYLTIAELNALSWWMRFTNLNIKKFPL